MILIYTDDFNPRIEYAFHLIFKQVLNVEIEFTSKSAEFLQSDLPKINYSYEKFGEEFYFKPHRLLHCKALIQPDIQPVWFDGKKYFFESSADSVFPFDPFAASFYLVTRYEEYLDSKRGKYNRFQATESILYKNNMLEKPVVNIWAQMLAAKLKERFPQVVFPKRKFKFISSIDIDNAWAYLNKGFFRTSGALMKSALKGDRKEFLSRLNVSAGRENDPYNTYEYLEKTFEGNEEKVIFFFLVGDYSRYDKNINPRNPKFRRLIQSVADKYVIGVHPSYLSSKKKNKKKVLLEKERLEQIIERKITRSRQHFLRLKFPRTYRRLIRAGINEDFSMGYASHAGFRAGISTPFLWFDLKKEEATKLLVYPFQVMDVTLRNYMSLSPGEAKKKIAHLMNEVKEVEGVFVGIWHNETINDTYHWKGYREVFEEMNKIGFQLANEQ